MIPRFYLKNFCAPGSERIWVDDLHTKQTYLADIGNVGVVKDFYAGAGGHHEDELEERLSKIEGDAAPHLHHFIGGNGVISEDLSRFLAWLAARTTWLRRAAQKSLPDFMRNKPELFYEHIGAEKDQKDLFDFQHELTGRLERVSLREALERVHDSAWRMRLHQDQYLDLIRIQAYHFRADHFPALKWVKLSGMWLAHCLRRMLLNDGRALWREATRPCLRPGSSSPVSGQGGGKASNLGPAPKCCLAAATKRRKSTPRFRQVV